MVQTSCKGSFLEGFSVWSSQKGFYVKGLRDHGSDMSYDKSICGLFAFQDGYPIYSPHI